MGKEEQVYVPPKSFNTQLSAATLCAILNSAIADFCKAKDECKTWMLYSTEV